PAKALDKRVAWKSTNPNVATVKNGIVHPIGVGTAIIKATTVSGGVQAEMRLTITGNALKGDINADGIVDVSDATTLVSHIIGTTTYPIELCDLNADGIVDVTDATTLITTILK
ncbi:MAG: dockerin type I repeat-containing protein, partial [Sodaliphilus sp.]|nr:dockerin type I repeat-containing protein [Sodaliphilus sp.]